MTPDQERAEHGPAELMFAEHRRRFRDFSVIDFVDERAIAELREAISVDVPVTLRWDWDYTARIAELRSLYEKGKRAAWDPETSLDWSIPVSRDEWILDPEASLLASLVRVRGGDEAAQRAAAFDELAYSMSQLLHGEQGGLLLCGQLTNLCPETDSKWYAATQVGDEARHAEALSKFLLRKMGTVHPVSPVIKGLLDRLLAGKDAGRKVIGMQIVFEGVALGTFDVIRAGARNPLLKGMLQQIAQDEARHAAFGVLYARRMLRTAEPALRADLEDFALSLIEALNANQRLDMLRCLGPEHGIDPWWGTRLAMAMPGFGERNAVLYRRSLLPNLCSLGLISERTRVRYEQLGLLAPAEPSGERAAEGEGTA